MTTKNETETNELAKDWKNEAVKNRTIDVNLADLPDVGERMLYRLFKTGRITTLEDLAAQDPLDLAKKIDIKDEQAMRLVKQARTKIAECKASE